MFLRVASFVVIFISVALPAYGDGFTTQDLYKWVFSLFSFGIVLALAYFTSKYLSKKVNKMNNNSNMNVTDYFNIDNNNKIVVVKILDKKYVLAINNNSTTLIDKYDSFEEIHQEDEIIKKDKKLFENILSSVSYSNKNKKTENHNLENINSKLINIKKKVESINAKDNGLQKDE